MFLDHDKYAQTVGDDLSGVTAHSKSLLFIKTLSVPDCGILVLTDFKFSRLPSRPRHSGSGVGGLEQQPLRPVAIGWYQAQGRVEPEQLSCMNMAIYRVFCAVHRVCGC